MGNAGLLETIARLEAEVIRIGQENERLRRNAEKGNRLSKDQIDELHRLCDADFKLKQVSAMLGITPQAVQYHRAKIGRQKRVARKRGPKQKTAAELAKESHYIELARKLRLSEFMLETGLTHTSYYKYKKKALSQTE